MWHATDPRGPWSETVTVKAVSGWEDPAPFWDDDGQRVSRPQRPRRGTADPAPDEPGRPALLDDGVEIYRGKVAEGPKLFKRRGDYYISLPEGGVETGGQTVLRSKSLYGPWERREVLVPGSPHQGGLVDLPNGESWFLGFKSTGHLGRVVHLLPVRWGEDGWPVFGDGGRTVDRWKKPSVGSRSRSRARPTSDEFDGPGALPAVAVEPQPGAGRLVSRGAAGLAAPRGAAGERHVARAEHAHPEAVGRRRRRRVRLDMSGMADGQRAGLTFISGSAFGWVGVAMRGGHAAHRLGAGRGPGADAGTPSGCAGATRGRRAARVQPRRPDLHRHRSPVHARVRPLEGGASRDLLLRAAGAASTSTPCAIATGLPRTTDSRCADSATAGAAVRARRREIGTRVSLAAQSCAARAPPSGNGGAARTPSAPAESASRRSSVPSARRTTSIGSARRA